MEKGIRLKHKRKYLSRWLFCTANISSHRRLLRYHKLSSRPNIMNRFLSSCHKPLLQRAASSIHSSLGGNIASHRMAAVSMYNLMSPLSIRMIDGSTTSLSSCCNFSTVAAASPSHIAADTKSNAGQDNNKSSSNDTNSKKKDDSNIFLDNLGKIFLSTIALVLLSLLRSNKGNNAKAALREELESNALLDPLEISDLRDANDFFTIEIWNAIVQEFARDGTNFVDMNVTYGQFMKTVLTVLKQQVGEGATIQFGHLMDRVVIKELERRLKQQQQQIEAEDHENKKEVPLSFLLTALSLAMNSTVADRVEALYNVMVLSEEDDNTPAEIEKRKKVTMQRVEEMVQHLQHTCQLVPDAQIVPTVSNIPYQMYRVGDGAELTRRACEGLGFIGEDRGVAVDLDDWYAILKSRSVCAWGECYVKRTDRFATSDR